ncbi:hypothetical protein [Actinomadura sp. WAC 06369]|uniref:hypothetical protein n=1 Tax=Actinomadura sp. WAC 06369 TaxID=2203193 RepID=UPI000F7B2495|nr:hypothetical protein [Actinomadura sp. WAC 06369]RSN64243.1 hypothetical protein DMH08_18190 [Actinomadura sp. WAC 06369]
MIGWDEDALAVLRAAVARGDGAAGAAVLAGRPLAPVLQYAGDVLVAALAEGVPGADERARACLAELGERGGPGDAELAAELAAALGDGPGPGLAPLPADLGAVAAALGADPAGGPWLLDLERGDVLPAEEAAGDAECGGDAGRWAPVPPLGAPEGEDARRGAARRWLAEQGRRPAPRTL